MTTVSFGGTTFPVNPQNLTRGYRRSIAVKKILGTKEALESLHRGLISISMTGTLTGTNAKTTMDGLETLMSAGQVAVLVTPTYPSGRNALLTELQFEVEKIENYAKLIRYNMNFLLVDSVSTPAWTLQVQNSGGSFVSVTGLMELSVDQQLGGVAAAFQFIADNRNGQNAHPVFDYGREVKIEIGYTGNTTRRLWGIIDTIDYGITKGTGSTVRVGGRDFSSLLLEGYVVDKTYTDEYPSAMVDDLLDGTGVGMSRLGSVDWNYWPTGNPWPIYLVFRGETRLEAIRKISDIYKMEFWIDSDDLNLGSPQLVWRQQSKISVLTANASAGQSYVVVENVDQWLSGRIYIADVNDNEMKIISSIDSGTNRIYFTSNLVHSYSTALGALATNFSNRFPKAKIWGQDILSIQIRRSGIPLRNRIEVYGDGVYCIADTDSSLLIPSGETNPGYDPTNSTKYNERRTIIEDSTILGQPVADVTAYTELLKLKDPDMEVRIRVVGDNDLQVGQYIVFDDDGITGLAGCWRLVSIAHAVSPSDGFTTELVLRGMLSSTTAKLLSDVIKDQAREVAGITSLFDASAQQTLIGTIVSASKPTYIVRVYYGENVNTIYVDYQATSPSTYEVGDEVILLFPHGDPQHPIVAGLVAGSVTVPVHGIEFHNQIFHIGLESIDGWFSHATGTGSVDIYPTGIRLQTEATSGRYAMAYYGDYSGVSRRPYTTNFDKEPRAIFLIELEHGVGTASRRDYWVLGSYGVKCAGFKFENAVLYAVVENGLGEVTESIAGITVTDLNKYEVRCIAGGFLFHVNDVLRATMTLGLPTGEQTAESTAVVSFYCRTAEAVTKQLYIRGVWVSQKWQAT